VEMCYIDSVYYSFTKTT